MEQRTFSLKNIWSVGVASVPRVCDLHVNNPGVLMYWSYYIISVLLGGLLEVATITLYPIGRPVRAIITLYPIGRPAITMYPMGRPIKATITLYPIGRPVRATIILIYYIIIEHDNMELTVTQAASEGKLTSSVSN